ncbi:hypothetical protein GCM10010319_46660 [Streptomyces blastmyceticus]|uniref:Uncharacterized protein n=1 Tax=Streptomyces blastmyceticus TaxID=68180 RepID=A0ABP3H8S3_9ACTN
MRTAGAAGELARALAPWPRPSAQGTRKARSQRFDSMIGLMTSTPIARPAPETHPARRVNQPTNT